MARTELECLLNDPVRINIGTKAKPDVIELREPANAEFAKMSIVLDKCMRQFLADNGALLKAAWAGNKAAIAKAPFSLAAVAGAMDPLLAVIVNRDAKFVSTMTVRQKVFVLEQYGELVGWGFIKDRFQTAMRNLTGSAPKSENVAAPSWLRPSSRTSAARSRS
jgi:hypothetical protein